MKWLADTGYDEKFGARPLGRVIQENIKKPLADELLFGKLEHGGTVRVSVEGEGAARKLAFEFLAPDPSQKVKARREEEDEDDAEDGDLEAPALVDATPRKSLPGPKEKKERPKGSGTVPGIPRRKDE